MAAQKRHGATVIGHGRAQRKRHQQNGEARICDFAKMIGG
jgi:hypothetical protein